MAAVAARRFDPPPKDLIDAAGTMQATTDLNIGRDTAAALAVDARGVSLTFETSDGQVEALSKIDLEIEAGDFVSFIGPSGCGKTTLLRVIADLEQPTEGTMMVNGLTPEEARLRRHYGYIFQAPALYPWRTIERNVMLPLEAGFVGGHAIDRDGAGAGLL
jgi:NitT/TauT family transport system ATP-binding protein